MSNRSYFISEGYRDLNIRLHAGGSYGRKGNKWAKKVLALIEEHSPSVVLDYGCGQGALGRALSGPIKEYDPAISGKDSLPDPADLVICTDVLEHVEPYLLSNVLDHLQYLTIKLLFVVVSTRPAKKHLEDGRNAHLIVENTEFWRPMFERRFCIMEWRPHGDEIIGTLRAQTA